MGRAIGWVGNERINYTEIVPVHLTEATIREEGRLVLEHLPFTAGQTVEVIVVPIGKAPTPNQTLRKSVLEYRDPFEPVGVDDWESAK
jgi:hypothetical protein